MKMTYNKLNILFFTSVALFASLIYTLTLIDLYILEIIAITSKIITTLVLATTGLYGAFMIMYGKHEVPTIKAYEFVILSAPIFACYVLYALADVTHTNLMVGAIAFDIATLARCYIIRRLLPVNYR